MKLRTGRGLSLLFLFLVSTTLVSFKLPGVHGLGWNQQFQQFPAGPSLLTDPKLRYVDGPPIGTSLKNDALIKFFDSNTNGHWDVGESVAYDSNNNGVWDTGDILIAGSPLFFLASLTADTSLKFVPTTTSSSETWAPGKAVVYDSNGNNAHDSGEPVLAGGGTGNSVWDPGETVVYDSNNNGIYDTNEPLLVGTLPVNGTILQSDRLVKFIDANNNGHWDKGETVAYDSNNNYVYDPGETVVAGLTPPTTLDLTPSVAQDRLGRLWMVWSELPQGATSNNWDVFLRVWNGTLWGSRQQVSVSSKPDSNPNVVQLSNGTMMVVWSSLLTGTAGSALFYRLYAQASPPYPTTAVIQLTIPPSGPAVGNLILKTDSSPSSTLDRYGRVWIAWARENSSISVSAIFYKYFNGTSWSTDFALAQASGPYWNTSPSIAGAKDGRIWVVWVSNQTSSGTPNIFYTTTDATIPTLPSAGIPAGSWASRTLLYSDTNQDFHPAIIQDRNGTQWVFFNASPVTGNQPGQIYAASSSNNGASWSSPTLLISGTVQQEFPAAVQMGDHKIWLFWNKMGSTTAEIWYTQSNTIQNVHDPGISRLAVSRSSIRSGDLLSLNVSVTNYGDYPENTSLTVRLNSTLISTVSISSLAPGSTVVVIINYQTVLPFWGRYVPTAAIQPVSGETPGNRGDDSWSGALVKVSPPGDVVFDGCVNILDAATLALAYGTSPGMPFWNANADINHDGVVDIFDAANLALFYGYCV